MRELVTLVMCLYNQLALTRACLASLRETTEPFRLVVIDNGSTDGTREFLQRFEAPYPLWIISSESNASVIASLNRAWRTAETEFLNGSLGCSGASPSQGLASPGFTGPSESGKTAASSDAR